MANFYERPNMTQLALELNTRSTGLSWEVAPGPSATTLCVQSFRQDPQFGMVRFRALMDGAGRWVVDFVDVDYGESEPKRPPLDLGLPDSVGLDRVADEVLTVIDQMDEYMREHSLEDPGAGIELMASDGSSASPSGLAPARSLAWSALLSALPVVVALPIGFRFVVGAYLALVSLIASLIVLLRLDWRLRSGKWIAVTAIVTSVLVILGHLSYLWNVLN